MTSHAVIRVVLLPLLAIGVLHGCMPSLQKPAAPEETASRTPSPAKVPACDRKTKRIMLVTAFPMRYPEQVKSGEFMDWGQTTGDELARHLNRGSRFIAVSASSRFPFESADLAPALEQRDGIPLATRWASEAKAQYILAGTIQDFGETRQAAVLPERHMQVDAYLYDALTGMLLARQSFSRQLLFGSLPHQIAPGTREFDSSRLGITYLGLIADIADWAAGTASCQPLAVRVADVKDRKLTLDAGSKQGLASGMSVQSWRPGEPPPARHPGIPPGARQQPTATIREVQPGLSVAEIPQQRFPPSIKAGDILYLVE